MLLNFKQLFSNWYITENKLLQEEEDQDNVNGKIKIIFILIKIIVFLI